MVVTETKKKERGYIRLRNDGHYQIYGVVDEVELKRMSQYWYIGTD